MRSAHLTRLLGLSLILAMAAGGVMPVGAQAVTPAPYVRVFVDGQPVPSDAPAVIAAGRVLVPLRGVFHRLGAVVTWDPSTQTVLAARGDTSITLRIGDTLARINGQATPMDVPALLVGGRTMVPLRFVSQALGAQVSWDAATATVQIASAPAYGLPPSQAYPPPAPPASSSTTVTGTVVGVKAGASGGQIQVLVDKAVRTFNVVATTAVSRINAGDHSGGSVALDALRPGDEAQVTLDGSGAVEEIHATYREVSGRIIAVPDAGVVVFENGDTFRLNRAAQIVRDGKAVDAGALRPGDVARLRLNPQSNEAWGATVRSEASAHDAGLASVTITPSGRELRAGDVIEVMATGSSGGRATFSIGALLAGVPMVESTSQRGTYYGSYTVQPGDVIGEGAVTVRLVAANGEVFTATAPAPVRINAGAGVPPAAPVLVITNPPDGSTITTPFTVTGRARPASRIKVTAEYDGSVLLFKVKGSLGTYVVTADQAGTWSAKFSDEPPVPGVNVIITAVEVDGAGRALSATARVTATIK